MIEAAVFNTITTDSDVLAAMSTRLYPVQAPDNATLPHATYQVISDISSNALGGVVNIRECRVQVTAWAETYDAVRSLGKLIRDAAQDASGTIASMDVDHMMVDSVNDVAYVSNDTEAQDLFGQAIDLIIFYRE